MRYRDWAQRADDIDTGSLSPLAKRLLVHEAAELGDNSDNLSSGGSS